LGIGVFEKYWPRNCATDGPRKRTMAIAEPPAAAGGVNRTAIFSGGVATVNALLTFAQRL
jgi:hypothetical protein